jgi:hypothetical protein
MILRSATYIKSIFKTEWLYVGRNFSHIISGDVTIVTFIALRQKRSSFRCVQACVSWNAASLQRILETAGGLPCRSVLLSTVKFTQLTIVTKGCVAPRQMEPSLSVKNLRQLFARTAYDMCLSVFPQDLSPELPNWSRINLILVVLYHIQAYEARFQASAAVRMITSLFLDVTCRSLVGYGRFGTTYRSHLDE